MDILPITCYRPRPELAQEFSAPPYDVFNRKQAASYVAEHPSSFLAIDRPETGFEAGHDPYAPDVYEHAASLVRDFAQKGIILRDDHPTLYLYRLSHDGHSQIGIVCACLVDDYLDGTIRRHEKTRADKERDRVEHIRALDAQTGPVFLTYEDSPAVDAIVSAASMGIPLFDFVDEDGTRHSVWRIAREIAVEALALAFSSVSCAYIADGHHRAAAAAALCQELRERDRAAGTYTPGMPYESFLAIIFPEGQLNVLAYDRVVTDTNGLDEDGLLRALEEQGFVVGEAQDSPVQPTELGHMGIYAFGSWRELRFSEQRPDAQTDPVGSLDVSIAQDRILGPILSIDDPRTSKRIAFVSEAAGMDELERRAGTDGVALALYPTTIAELMRVADAGLLMPPKSTWFAPKPRSGLFLRRI